MALKMAVAGAAFDEHAAGRDANALLGSLIEAVASHLRQFGGKLRLNEELMRGLEEGLLSPEEAAGAIEVLLSEYPAAAREEIFASLVGSYGASSGLRSKAAALAEEAPEPVQERVLGHLDLYGGLWASSQDTQREALRLFQLRRRGEVIVFARQGRVEAPAFQFFERDLPYLQEPRFSVRRPNQILLADRDPWGALDWWVAPNGRLDGRAPAALLDTEEEVNLTSLAESVTELVG